jgi:hypothetical protein
MLRFPELEHLGVVAAMSGAAEGDCGTVASGAPPNGRARFLAALGLEPDRVVGAQQVHGARVATVGHASAGRGGLCRDDALPETDGLVTNTAEVALAIAVADCVPVYLVDPVRRVVALLHAGREGTFATIAGAGVRTMRDTFDTNPADLHGLIGPSAGPERYEVSPALADAWRAAGLPARGRLLDLWEANARQLTAAGVPRANVRIAGRCTIGDPAFHSHRRDASGKRNLAILKLEERP